MINVETDASFMQEKSYNVYLSGDSESYSRWQYSADKYCDIITRLVWQLIGTTADSIVTTPVSCSVMPSSVQSDMCHAIAVTSDCSFQFHISLLIVDNTVHHPSTPQSKEHAYSTR